MSTATATALTSLAAALTELAAAVGADSAPTSGVKVGDYVRASDIRAVMERLPVGSKLTDKDDDVWTKTGAGWVLYGEQGDPTECDPTEYAPMEVTSIPAAPAEPVPTPSPAPISYRIGSDHPRDLIAEPSLRGDGGAFLLVSGGSLHLTREQATDLASTLIAITERGDDTTPF